MPVKTVVIDLKDNVAVAALALKAHETLTDLVRTPVVVQEDIPQWHKVAIAEIPQGQPVLKYGECIGIASTCIKPGEHVHAHNLKPEGD